MDWPRARAVLLVAFTIVNLVLAYSLWGPAGMRPIGAQPSARSQLVQLRSLLDERGLILPSGVVVPETPLPMKLLRVEYRPDLEILDVRNELSFGDQPALSFHSRLDPGTQAIIIEPLASEGGMPPINFADRAQVREAAEEFLEANQLLPIDAQLSGIFSWGSTGAMVEFVPRYQGIPVYSGYLRVYLSIAGVERVVAHWVSPLEFKEGPSKAVRPASEALLRLAGHLEQTDENVRMILDVRLGYYSGPSVTVPMAEAISSWETVPVWRITLDNGMIYYVNAFNGELES